jgi:thiol-disulfide isomerase/thioredoxin
VGVHIGIPSRPPNPEDTITKAPVRDGAGRLVPGIVGGALVPITIMLWAAFGTTSADRGPDAARSGPRLPGFSVETLSGEVFSFPTERPTAIYFTGSTCASCLPKAAALDRIEREADGAVAVLGVDIDGFDTEEMFRDWIAHAGTPRHAFAMDSDFRLLDLFEVTALSTVVVTDGTGRLVWRSADDVGAPELRRVLARAGLR